MKKSKTKYVAKFSNGAIVDTNTSRPTAYAWRLEWSGEERTGYACGFSSSIPLAAKALDAWKVRLIKNGATIKLTEIAEAVVA